MSTHAFCDTAKVELEQLQEPEARECTTRDRSTWVQVQMHGRHSSKGLEMYTSLHGAVQCMEASHVHVHVLVTRHA